MPLTEAERQQRYRDRMEAEGVKRYQLMVPNDVANQVKIITQQLKCTKTELFTRLIQEEYRRIAK